MRGQEKKTSMPRRRAALIALAAVALLAGLLPAAASATEPWWQVLTSTRPSNLWEPEDPSEVQEVKTTKSLNVLAAKVEVGGTVVGCLGAGELVLGASTHFSADELCESLAGFPASESAAEFEAMLEGPYGAGEVQVSGGPAGSAPLAVTTPWGKLPLQVSVLKFNGVLALGTASSAVTSEGSGTLAITLTNVGDAPVDGASKPVTITDQLPAGLAAYGFFNPAAGGKGEAGPVTCTLVSTGLISCGFASELPSYEAIEIDVLVATTASPPAAGASGTVSVSGGGAEAKEASQPIKVSAAPVTYGAESFNVGFEEEGGGEAKRAGRHPFQWTNTIQWRSGRLFGKNHPFPQIRREAFIEQPALPRNSGVTFPAGFVGKVNAVPTCELAIFLQRNTQFTNDCPDSSVVGVASVTVIESQNFGFLRLAVPIFNLPPARGEPARFGFMPAGVPVLIETSVDPDDGYRITGEVRNAPQIAQVISATLSIWGVPGDRRHDSARGWGCAFFASKPSECPSSAERDKDRNTTPFLRMPVSCASPLPYELALEPWNVAPDSFIDRTPLSTPPLTACNQEPFNPTITAALTSKAAESPSGLDFQLDMPNEGLETPEGTAETQFKKIEVTLPEGVTVNPSAAEGLATCSPADYARERFDSAPGEGCPEASKIGSVKISTPLLPEEAEGALYQATPNENPFDSLIALYLVAKIPDRGILVKQAGVVRPDPRTGQLISTFDDVPQVPVSSFKLHFREGGRAPLVAPPRCGTFQTTARFVPWSAQDPSNPNPDEIVERSASFQVERGVNGGPCPPGGVPPFHPQFEAGALNNAAATYSPFVMRLIRADGEQDMTKFSATLPAGELGSLRGVAKCPDTAIAAAQAKTGREELASPSCPQSSQIGTTLAGAGVGAVLTYVPGKLYLGGPFHGDPLSVIAITPAVAGPFDVGTVVVHEALTVNPKTAEVEVDGAASDPIPHILAGIPLKLRDLRVNVDRANFTLNPTSCAEMQTKATLFGSNLDVFSAADDVPVHLSARYQAAGCARLGFAPKLGLTLKGGTRRGAFPRLHAVYRPRPGDANLKRLALIFPHSEFIEQGHFRTICTRVQFAAGQGFGSECPKGSIYGHVKVITPLLDEPLEGPVYLRSSNHNLPDAVFALHGIVNAEVDLRIDSVHGGLRATVEEAPDVPVTSAVVDMQGGPKGLFVNSRNICAKRFRATAQMLAQSGKADTLKPVLRSKGCGKGRKSSRRRHHRS